MTTRSKIPIILPWALTLLVLLLHITGFSATAWSGVLEGSLFFLPEEVAAIEESRRQNGMPAMETKDLPDSAESMAAPAPSLPRYLHLSAVILDSTGKFEVWLNGRRHDRYFDSELVSLVAVDAGRVRLKLRGGGRAGQVVELGTNQTFDLASGRLIEGRPVAGYDPLDLVPRRVR